MWARTHAATSSPAANSTKPPASRRLEGVCGFNLTAMRRAPRLQILGAFHGLFVMSAGRAGDFTVKRPNEVALDSHCAVGTGNTAEYRQRCPPLRRDRI